MSKYDPNKQYKWEETDEFIMNGNQFGLILNSFRNILAKPESKEVMIVARAEAEMTKILAEGVESGVVKEVLPVEANSAEPAVRQSPMMVKK